MGFIFKDKETAVEKIPYIFEFKTERRAQNNSEERKPAQAIADVSREREKRFLDERNPDCFNRTCNSRIRDEPKGDDGDEKPCEECLHDPSVAGCAEDGGGDPPPEDEGSESERLQVANKVVVSREPRKLDSIQASDGDIVRDGLGIAT